MIPNSCKSSEPSRHLPPAHKKTCRKSGTFFNKHPFSKRLQTGKQHNANQRQARHLVEKAVEHMIAAVLPGGKCTVHPSADDLIHDQPGDQQQLRMQPTLSFQEGPAARPQEQTTENQRKAHADMADDIKLALHHAEAPHRRRIPLALRHRVIHIQTRQIKQLRKPAHRADNMQRLPGQINHKSLMDEVIERRAV